MGRRSRAQELIVTGLYEPLAPQEAEELERLLNEYTGLRTEADALRQMVDDIPQEMPAFEGDLLPAVRGQLTSETESFWKTINIARRFVVPVVAVAGMVALIATGIIPGNAPVEAPRVLVANEAGVDATEEATDDMAASPLARAMDQADALLEAQNPGEAVRVLDAALASDTSATARDMALAMQGTIEYEWLNRYAEAYATFGELRREHGATFESRPDIIEYYDLLADAEASDFEALYALDVARQSGSDRFERLEQVLAQYPETLVAHEALHEIELAAAAEESLERPGDGLRPEARVARLENVLERCTHPVAKQQIALAIGDAYFVDLGDLDTAREHYTTAVDGSHEGVSEAARQALARVNALSR